MSITIYHNPRCSKSRQTLELLRAHGHEPHIIRYLESPPSVADLQHILSGLGVKARDLMRRNERLYTELGLGNESLTEQELLVAINQNPSLLERPVVVNGKRVAVGRPPELVLEII